MATLGDLMIRVGADASDLAAEFRSVIDKTAEMADAVAEKLDSISDVGRRLSVLGASLTTAITVPLEEIGRRSIDVAAQFEQTQVAFTTLIGSAQAGKEMLTDLYQFAATTPFEIPTVLQGARLLSAMQFAPKDIIPIMRTVGDAAAGLGLGQERLQLLLYHLGQIRSEGKLSNVVLREMGRDGIGAAEMIAEAMGKPLSAIKKLATAGDIDATTAINALLSGMNRQFGGMMENQMGTLAGQWSNLKDQITLTAVAIGNILLPAGKQLVAWAQDGLSLIRELAQWFGQLSGPVQASAIALLGLAAVSGPVIGFVGALGFSLPHIVAGFTALSNIGPFIASLAGGFAEFFGAIGTNIWMIGSLISEEGLLAGVSYALEAGVAALGAVFLSVPALIVGVTVALAALATWVYTHWDGVKAAVSTVWDGLGDLWNATLGPAINGIKSMFEGLWSLIPSGFLTMWGAVKSGFSEFKTWLDEKNDQIYESTKKWMEQFPGVKKMEEMGSAFSKAEQRGKDQKGINEAESTMHLKSGGAFQIADPREAWIEKHNKQIETYSKALDTLSEAYKKNEISADELKKAQDRLEAIKNEKMPDFSSGEGKVKAPKLDRAAMNLLSGEHAHDEAALAFRKAEIEHEYQMEQPGSAERTVTAAEEIAREQIKAAEERKRALDQIALEEMQKTLANLSEKLKVAGLDKAGHEQLIEAKQKAEDKFLLTVQKNTFELETVKKQANDRIEVEEQKAAEKREKRQQKEYEMAIKTVDDTVKAEEKKLQIKLKQYEFDATMTDKQLQFELETGTLSKDQYLRLKQEQYDKAYRMEMDAIAKEREEVEHEFDGLSSIALSQIASATTDTEREQASDRLAQINADRDKRMAPLDERQQTVENKHAERKLGTELGIKKDEFDTVWAPVQSGFSNMIANLVKGTQTFKQAWQGMAVSVLGTWINTMSQNAAKWATHLAQMMAQWVAHKLGLVAIHTAANEARVASDAAASAQSRAISLSEHFHEIMLAAKTAAAKAFQSVVGIPVIGPILAPIAAAAAFAGVMAFSAEGGALLPNQSSVLFGHPQEMVLPKHISVGLQNLIASGGLGNASSIMNQTQGGSMSSTMLQMMRNTAQADSGDTHNYNGALHYHAANGETLTVDKFGQLFKTYVRQNNMKMA